MSALPKRIKVIDKSAIAKLRLHSDLFFLFWLLCLLLNSLHRGDVFISQPRCALAMAVLSIVLIVAGVVYLVRAMKVLYPPKYFWGNLVAYVLGLVLPIFGGIISLAVVLSVFIDSRKVIESFSGCTHIEMPLDDRT